MHYYSFNIGDYIKETHYLDEIEDLAYRRMLDLYYLSEEPLPSDVEKIAKLIRMRTHCERITNVLSDFFILEKDGYHCKRCDIEIFKYKEKSQKAASSAKSRWKKSKEKQKLKDFKGDDANALRTQCDRYAKQETINKKQETSNKSEQVQDIFEFWKETMSKNGGTVLDSKRKSCILKMLKIYPFGDLISAIEGCSKTRHNMGYDKFTGKKTGTKYNDLTLIFKDSSNLERFRDTDGDINGNEL
tara:strand:- start:148 stop:879 length:732 start_codon:yes stop_codon:yes gene_type:complete